MPSSSDIVTGTLRRYADRGIFRGFGCRPGRRGRTEFRFVWHAERPHLLIYDPKSKTFTFRDLLPGVAYPSAMDADLRRFLRGRCERGLPEHRRIDPKRATVRAVNRGGKVSVELKVRGRNLEYGLGKVVKLVNEIFLNFLAGPYEEYMVKNFGTPEE